MSLCKRFVANVMHSKMSIRQAARAAGFAHGVPSPQARRLLKMAQLIRETPQLAEEVVRNHKRLTRTLSELEDAQAWKDALDALEQV